MPSTTTSPRCTGSALHALATVGRPARPRRGRPARGARRPAAAGPVGGRAGRPDRDRMPGGWRGARGWALAVAAAVVRGRRRRAGRRLGGRRPRVVPTPTTPQPSAAGVPDVVRAAHATRRRPTGPLSRTVAAVLVCAQTDEGSVWAGSLPPDAPVSLPLAVDALALQPRTERRPSARTCRRDRPSGWCCAAPTAAIRTYANEGLACNGWPALASYYVALAEQGALTRRSGSGATDRRLPRLSLDPRQVARATGPGAAEPAPRDRAGDRHRLPAPARRCATAIPRYRADPDQRDGRPAAGRSSTPTWPGPGPALAPGSTCTDRDVAVRGAGQDRRRPAARAEQRLRRPVHRRLDRRATPGRSAPRPATCCGPCSSPSEASA